MEQPSPSPIDDLSLDALRSLVKELVVKLAEQDAEIKALKDEVTRLKGHKGKPKLKPSGMEQATEKRSRRRGKKKGSRPSRQKLMVNEEQTLTITPPDGSRFKGYQNFVVQELRLEARVIRYRRERWLTAEGKVVTAPLPSGLRGHFGPELLRFILLQHHQGQVTVDRIATFLTSLGLVISKRQVLRLLTGDVAAFAAEADDVLRAGLSSTPWITVDDTGARHRARNGVTTQIGNDRFTFFGTTFSKSRKNFLELLRAGHRDYVINAEALAYMRARKDELLRVLDRPEIPLHTNGSENDIRCHVTKRKISGGTWPDHGRQARDTFLGLLKTCQKLGISFFEYLGNRLGVPDAPIIQPLPILVSPA